MHGQLVITIFANGQQTKKVHNITSENICIGRKEDNDIVIKNKYVSSHHGYIKFIDDKMYYVDRNSVNGTYLNNQYIKKSSGDKLYPYEVADGDRLFIGVLEEQEGCDIHYYKEAKFPCDEEETANRRNHVEKNTPPEQKKPIKIESAIKEETIETEGTLVVFSVNNHKTDVKQYILSDKTLTIGRKTQEASCDIVIANNLISRRQATIENTDGHYWMSEHGTNRFIINDDKKGIPTGMKKRLRDKDILFLGDLSQGNGVVLFFSTNMYDNYQWNAFRLTKQEISIGRSGDCDIVLPQLSVSRKHAAIVHKEDEKYIIVDKKSENGIIADDHVVHKEEPLHYGSDIDILSNKIIFLSQYILYAIPKNVIKEKTNTQKGESRRIEKYSYKGGMQVELRNISRQVPCKNGTGIHGGNKKFILQNVSCTIKAGQLVAILGGSGAGKTTFMNCINGFEPATSGTVKINGKELYRNYQVLKQQIGYVPQQDIVYDELTLKSMLTYVAKLRLPKDLSKNEITDKVNEVIGMVDLRQHANTMIKKLSGGQRKRASIAVELLSDPELFFLDEPTSGLDPEAETNLMKQLKNLSQNRGKTVIVITHTLQNIHLFDKIVFLAPGGKLCFFGSPKDALTFFKVENLSDAYEKIAANVDGYVKKFEKNRRAG